MAALGMQGKKGPEKEWLVKKEFLTHHAPGDLAVAGRGHDILVTDDPYVREFGLGVSGTATLGGAEECVGGRDYWRLLAETDETCARKDSTPEDEARAKEREQIQYYKDVIQLKMDQVRHAEKIARHAMDYGMERAILAGYGAAKLQFNRIPNLDATKARAKKLLLLT